jgi:hypothetical protein
LSAPSAKIIVHFTFVHSVNVLNIPNTPLALLSSPGAPSRFIVAKMINTISFTLKRKKLPRKWQCCLSRWKLLVGLDKVGVDGQGKDG